MADHLAQVFGGYSKVRVNVKISTDVSHLVFEGLTTMSESSIFDQIIAELQKRLQNNGNFDQDLIEQMMKSLQQSDSGTLQKIVEDATKERNTK